MLALLLGTNSTSWQWHCRRLGFSAATGEHGLVSATRAVQPENDGRHFGVVLRAAPVRAAGGAGVAVLEGGSVEGWVALKEVKDKDEGCWEMEDGLLLVHELVAPHDVHKVSVTKQADGYVTKQTGSTQRRSSTALARARVLILMHEHN